MQNGSFVGPDYSSYNRDQYYRWAMQGRVLVRRVMRVVLIDPQPEGVDRFIAFCHNLEHYLEVNIRQNTTIPDETREDYSNIDKNMTLFSSIFRFFPSWRADVWNRYNINKILEWKKWADKAEGKTDD